MNVDTIGSPGGMVQQPPRPADQIDEQRRKKDAAGGDIQPQAENNPQKIQSEELIDQIKAVTEDGLYSVRFEKDDKLSDLVVKIFDNETQEVIRQIPAEEMLSFKASFAELTGNLVDTKG